MFKVFVTSAVPKKILAMLEENFELKYHDSDEGLSEEQLIEGVRDMDAIFCPLSDKITKNVIDAGENLKIIANYGAQVIDCGTPVLSMHAPYEIVSKIDAYMTYKAYSAFYK